MTVSKQLLEQVKQLIPPLTGALHKGQAGRVGIVGGAEEYSGAPFFAAMAAMRVGVDLAHVLCAPSAAGAIKSYSPDLIVHPLFAPGRQPDAVEKELDSLLTRLHVLVIGPGLGRSDSMQQYAARALSAARARHMYIVLDADGLFMVQRDPALVHGYTRAVLTPNVVEYSRLCAALDLPEDARAPLLAEALGGVTILQKGSADVVAYNQSEESVDAPGGLKRCGGQGDVLSGALSAFLAWGKSYESLASGRSDSEHIPSHRIPFLASIGAALLTRSASRRAFERHGRALVTQDILEHIGPSFQAVFDDRLPISNL